MKERHAKKFILATQNQIKDFENNKQFFNEIIKSNILKTVWMFKMKKDLDRKFRNDKASVLPHGEMKHSGINFFAVWKMYIIS